MSALIESILTRKSQPVIDNYIALLDIERIVQCALTAPDHRALKPWRFILCSREDCEKLIRRVELVALAQEASTASVEEVSEALQRLFTTAPQVMICVLNVDQSGRVPKIEQVLSAGAAIQNMIIAAEAMGHSGYWRTGKLAYSPLLIAALGLEENALICGLLCLGHLHKRSPLQAPQRPELDRHFFTLESLMCGECI
ncbi:nitroreductase family protein [uncultured Microbulbifer sp.]|uniref:nitroreductase family protein n=1 Tax=uncultured Microbulbifer sp. TaxID=348147 RepID=UPI002620C081|nr:nitroreductase family protein [uncultured Microbulbifer sp.]